MTLTRAAAVLPFVLALVLGEHLGTTARAASESPQVPPAPLLESLAAQPPAASGAATSPTGQVGTAQPPVSIPRQFTGAPVSLDFQQADLRAVLRVFAEISGLNIVIDPTVQGTVDVALRDVPWDQALDIILRANRLGYSLEGSIVRIASLAALADEDLARQKVAEAQLLSGDLHVFTRTLSYAKAEDLTDLLTKTALSARGTVEVDPRTNTIIIRDLQPRLDAAAALIGTLDRAELQVEIEARIVQTTKAFARELGVQWGLAGRVDPAIGNTTNLAFPNNGSLSGRLGTGNAPAAVNLPAAGATSAIGLALGSLNGAFNLDVALTALENSGNGRLLSTPRVTMQNNIEGEVHQGVQIPVVTPGTELGLLPTTTFRDVLLTLKVKPQITAAGTVIMSISVSNSTPNYSRQQADGNVPVNTQGATTTVLVNDGQTTVIGGIFTSSEASVTDRTPGLGRVPVLKWLFRHDRVADDTSELLIFITPRIIG